MPRSRAARAVVAILAIAAALVILVVPSDARLGVARIGIVGAGIAFAAVYFRRSRSATASTPERFELELRRSPEEPHAVASLRAAEMAVRFSITSAHDFDVRLRPMLRDLARWRLLANLGVDMDLKPEVARRALGDELSNLIDAPAEPPSFRAPGLPLARVDAALDQLEQI